MLGFGPNILGSKLVLDDADYRARLQQSKLRTITFGDSVQMLNRDIGQTTRTMRSAVGVMTTFTLGLTGASLGVGQSIKLALEWEAGLTKVGTLFGSRQEALDRYSVAVRQMSTEFGMSMADINEALYQALSAGVAADDAIEFVRVAAKTAVGGFTDVRTAVDGVTTVLNAYGKSASEASAVVDVLLATSNLGKTTIEELSRSLGNVVPTAAAMKVSLEEVAAVLATSTSVAIQTAESSTALRQVMAAVIKPSGEAAKVADKLGIQFSAAALKADGLATFLQKVSKAANGNDEAIATLFGSVEAFNILMSITSGQGAKKFEQNLRAMGKATGTLDSQFGEVSKSTSFQLTRIRESFNDMLREVGIGLIEEFGGSLDSIPAKLKKLVPEIKQGIKDFVAAVREGADEIVRILEVYLLTKGAGVLRSLGNSMIGFGGLYGQPGEAQAGAGASVGGGVARAAAGVARAAAGIAGLVVYAEAVWLTGKEIGLAVSNWIIEGENEIAQKEIDASRAGNLSTLAFGMTRDQLAQTIAGEIADQRAMGPAEMVKYMISTARTGAFGAGQSFPANKHLLKRLGVDTNDEAARDMIAEFQQKMFSDLIATTVRNVGAEVTKGVYGRLYDPTMLAPAANAAILEVMADRKAAEEALIKTIDDERVRREENVAAMLSLITEIQAKAAEYLWESPLGTTLKRLGSIADNVQADGVKVAIDLNHLIFDKDKKRGHSIAARAARGDGTARHLNARYRAVILRTGAAAGVIEPLAENYHSSHLLNPEG